MQILALYVRESTSEEGALRPLNVNVLLLHFLTSAKRFFFFFFFFFSESRTQQEVVTYTSGSPPCSLPPTEHLYLQAFSEQVSPPARHHC